MLGLDHDEDPARLEARLDGVRDLGRQPLLHLGPPRVPLDDPGQLRQPRDPPVLVGDVRDVGLAHERDQMVLAHAVERDVAQDDLLLGEEAGGQRGQRRVLVPSRDHRAGKRVSAVDQQLLTREVAHWS